MCFLQKTGLQRLDHLAAPDQALQEPQLRLHAPTQNVHGGQRRGPGDSFRLCCPRQHGQGNPQREGLAQNQRRPLSIQN